MNDFPPADLIGHIDRFDDFKSNYVIPRRVDVWLPPDYDSNLQQRYAVLYMHDGQNLFDPATSKLSHTDWGMDETISRLAAESRIRPTMVVGLWSTEKRGMEYMPQKVAEGKRLENFNRAFEKAVGGKPESDLYLRFIIEEIKPFIDHRYRTLSDRENTFMMGSSLGGLISLYALCEYPQVFKGAGCVSTHFPIGRGIMLQYMREHLPQAGEHLIYFDHGTKTVDKIYEKYQVRADRIMEERGYTRGEDWITQKFEGHAHSEVYWRQRVHIPLEFLLK